MFRGSTVFDIKRFMIVTIHQPDFLPWLGFFDRWQKSDVYIVLDDVQFLRRGWHHRDKIKTKDGVKWLTVPVLKKGRYHQLIRDVKIDNATNWQTKHLRTIEASYEKAPNFEWCFEEIEDIYKKNHALLMDLNMELLSWAADFFDITTPLVFASQYRLQSFSTQRLVELVKLVGGHCYMTGLGAKGYLDETLFEAEGIQVVWQDYTPPVHEQLHGSFVPMLSCLDFIMMRNDRTST